MVMVNIDEDLYALAKKIVEARPIDYPTLKNFVERAVRQLIKGVDEDGSNS